jgi:hypothetical protein
LDGFTRYSDCDLAVYAGKYFGAPMSTGFVSGTKELVDRVRQQGPIGFERGFKGVGRGYKVDAAEIYGLVAALQEWVGLDHWAQRAEPAYKRAQILREMLPNVSMTLIPEQREHIIPYHRILVSASVENASLVQEKLAQGDPSVRVDRREGYLLLNMLTLQEGEIVEVAEKLGKVL